MLPAAAPAHALTGALHQRPHPSQGRRQFNRGRVLSALPLTSSAHMHAQFHTGLLWCTRSHLRIKPIPRNHGRFSGSETSTTKTCQCLTGFTSPGFRARPPCHLSLPRFMHVDYSDSAGRSPRQFPVLQAWLSVVMPAARPART